MELETPTEVSLLMATHRASVIIDLPQVNILNSLFNTTGGQVSPIAFSGSESDGKKWKASFSRDPNHSYNGSACKVDFYHAETVYVVEGKATLAQGSSTQSYSCKKGAYGPGYSVLAITGIDSSSAPANCRISFSIKYLRPEVGKERCSLRRAIHDAANDDENLHVALEYIFSSGKYPDMSFVVGDHVIPAHKAIVAARAPYFDKMMSSGMEEAVTSCVKLDESTDAAAFKLVLKYIYGGQLPESLDEDAVRILPLADQYDLARLKEACFFHMEKGLTKENVCDTLILADFYRGASLKKICLERLREWGSSLESKFLEKLKEHPQLMVEFIQSK